MTDRAIASESLRGLLGKGVVLGEGFTVWEEGVLKTSLSGSAKILNFGIGRGKEGEGEDEEAICPTHVNCSGSSKMG